MATRLVDGCDLRTRVMCSRLVSHARESVAGSSLRLFNACRLGRAVVSTVCLHVWFQDSLFYCRVSLPPSRWRRLIKSSPAHGSTAWLASICRLGLPFFRLAGGAWTVSAWSAWGPSARDLGIAVHASSTSAATSCFEGPSHLESAFGCGSWDVFRGCPGGI